MIDGTHKCNTFHNRLALVRTVRCGRITFQQESTHCLPLPSTSGSILLRVNEGQSSDFSSAMQRFILSSNSHARICIQCVECSLDECETSEHSQQQQQQQQRGKGKGNGKRCGRWTEGASADGGGDPNTLWDLWNRSQRVASAAAHGPSAQDRAKGEYARRKSDWCIIGQPTLLCSVLAVLTALRPRQCHDCTAGEQERYCSNWGAGVHIWKTTILSYHSKFCTLPRKLAPEVSLRDVREQ
jgi:hypothetical protein